MVRKHVIVVSSLLAVLMAASVIAGESYDLTWSTIDGGGGYSAGGGFELEGTIGQPDAGVLSGGSFTLQGGFWRTELAPPCPGDLDGNGSVDLSDLAGMLSAFGSINGDVNYILSADLDNDGDIDLADLAGLLALFGTTC